MDAPNEVPLTTKRVGRGKTKEVTLNVVGGEKLGEGYWGVVRRVHAQQKRREPLPFAYKYMEEDIEKSGAVQRQLGIHERLRKAKNWQEFVIPTFRQTKDGLLMTDLSNEGKNLVLSWNDVDEASIQKSYAQRPELWRTFLTTDLSGLDEKIEQIAQAVTEVDIDARSDSSFFVMYPDGSYKIYIADLDAVKIRLIENDEDVEELLQENRKNISALKQELMTARANAQKIIE